MTVSVVTGTTSDIGLATVVRLAKAGHKVYAGIRNPSTADDLKAAIEQTGGTIAMLKLDVTDEGSIQDAIASVLAAEGRIDVLINNAGISSRGSVEETSLEVFRGVFETNFFGLVAVTQAVLPGMRERSSGAIINVGSLAGVMAFAAHSVYAPTKYAVEAHSEILAQQMLPFNVRVAVIEPGVIPTALIENTQKTQGPLNPDSPYAVHGRRFKALFDTQLNHRTPASADDVAQTIEHAITTDDPKLCYLVGQDAVDFVAARRRVSDEDYIKFSAIEEDEDYFDAMKDWVGKEYFRP
ncbi:MAG: SDR family oxidoreductase [Alphaproteobacteria bacterium]